MTGKPENVSWLILSRLPGLSLLAGLALVAACGSSTPAHEHPEPLSASEHERHAADHDAQAQVHSGRVEAPAEGEDVQCVDVGGPLNSGGERMPVMRPCWTKAEQNAAYLRAAERQHKAASDHRNWAKRLIEAEEEACSSLAPSERDTSPFLRRPDILAVTEYKESGDLLGAKVTFRKVAGLSKEWFQASIRCHQARAAKLGFDPAFMPHSPLALKRLATSVEETPTTLIITLRSKDPIIASEAYGRSLNSMSGDEPAQ